jgi:hypothetical protein
MKTTWENSEEIRPRSNKNIIFIEINDQKNLEVSPMKYKFCSSIALQLHVQPNDFGYCLRESHESGRCREYVARSRPF